MLKIFFNLYEYKNIMQANQKSLKELYKRLTVGMNHHDPDVAEMAAKDLSKHILQGDINLKVPQNSQLAKQITDQFLKQVGSLSFSVHSAAIRCLAQIVPMLGNQQLIHIFKSTITSIVDPRTQSKRMQVFTSSASTMINLAPPQLGMNLSALFVECVSQFIKLHTKKLSKSQEQVVISLLHLIVDFSSKWPDVVGNSEVKYDRQRLLQILLRNVKDSFKIDLIRKSNLALQKMAAVFTKQNFEFVLEHKELGLMTYFRLNNHIETQQDFKKVKNTISSLNHIVHASNRKMKDWAKSIAKIAVDIINSFIGNSEYVYLVTQIIENSIDCLTCLVKSFSIELSEYLQSQNYQFLSNFVEKGLTYDTEGYMNYMNLESEMGDQYEEQEQEYYSEGSVCWKVREATLTYLTILMKKCSLFKQNQIKSSDFLDLLSLKLIQQNENVSKKGFDCFNLITESITKLEGTQHEEELVLRRVKSNQGNFALDLVNKITDKVLILFKHKKTKEETKIEAARTLYNLLQLLHDQIFQNHEASIKLLQLIQQLLPKTKTQCCVLLIKSSKVLINANIEFKSLHNLIKILLNLTKNPNFKVIAGSFEAIRKILEHYHSNLYSSGKLNQILNIVIPKLKQHDADKLVKTQVIKCLGPIFEYLFVQLPENVQNDILANTEAKLKIQIDKSVLLNQIPLIPQNYSVKKSQVSSFKTMLDIAAESIGTANFQLSNISITCCNRLLTLQGLDITDKNVEQILLKSKPLLMDGRIPTFIFNLIQRSPQSFKNYSEIIVKTTQIGYILKMIEKKIISEENTINILKVISVKEPNTTKLSTILSSICKLKKKLIEDINDTKWGQICLGALGYIGDIEDVKNIEQFIRSVRNNDQVRLEGARAIGNIVSRNSNMVIYLMKASQNPQDGYLYLHALKEMLNFSVKQFPELHKIIEFIYTKSQESDRQTNKHLLAECIGFIAKFSPSQLKNILKSVEKERSSVKFIVASSLRYALQDRKDIVTDQVYSQYIETVLRLSFDKDVNVREGAFKSLNSIVGVLSRDLKHLLSRELINNILDAMTVKAELIKEIDYGFSKEKKDLGKGLRIQAFNFIKAIINNRQIQSIQQFIIAKCLQKINEQTSSDLILKRISIIHVLCKKDSTGFMPYINQFASKVGPEGILRQYLSSSSQNQEQRSEGYLKNLLKEIAGIIKLNKQNLEIVTLVNKIRSFQRLNNLMNSIQSSD